MAMVHGKAGNVRWAAELGVGADVNISHVLSWSMDATADVAETTAMAAAPTYKTYLAGWSDWTATVECNADDAGTEIDYTGSLGLGDDYSAGTTDIELALWFGATEAIGILYGPAVCTGVATSADVHDVLKITYTFQGKGDPAFVTNDPFDP